MHNSVLEFFRKWLPADLKGKNIIEIGAMNFNGSVKNILTNDCRRGNAMEYQNYIGVDTERQEWFVDVILRVEELTKLFAENSFDIVIFAETLEHVADWKRAIHNLKSVVKENGFIFITTRAPGFKWHAYPRDCWRFTPENMQAIFSDFIIINIEKDSEAPGVFVVVRKPENYIQNTLNEIVIDKADMGLIENKWPEK